LPARAALELSGLRRAGAIPAEAVARAGGRREREVGCAAPSDDVSGEPVSVRTPGAAQARRRARARRRRDRMLRAEDGDPVAAAAGDGVVANAIRVPAGDADP